MDRAIAGDVGAIHNPTCTRLDGLPAGVLPAAARGRALLVAGLALLGAATRVDPLGRACAVFLFPLVVLGCACLLTGALSPRTSLGHPAQERDGVHWRTLF
jgi:hypothetical protein